MDIVLHDIGGNAVARQAAPDDVKRIDFPAVESDVVISGYTLDGAKFELTEPLTVQAGQYPRLKLWS